MAWRSCGFTAHEALRTETGTPALAVHWRSPQDDARDEHDPNWRAWRLSRLIGNGTSHEWVALDGGSSWCLQGWFDGTPVAGLLARERPDTATALAIASAAARCLGRLHAASVVHGALHPASLLWSSGREEVRLADLGFASHPGLPLIAHPETGRRTTLLYQSPEATGRLGGLVDERSDLYSLGAILYELLVGTPPFNHASAVEIVHAHLAQEPAPAAERAPGIPHALSWIVSKLLAKLPEERYRSGAGLAADLDLCREALGSGRAPAIEELRKEDVPARVRLPRRLYGRAREEAALRAAFDARCATPGRSLVLVSGYAGIGKTSLVESLRRRVVEEDAFFAAGKFDQRTQSQPFVGLASALRNLCQQLLALPEAELRGWRDRLVSNVGQRMALLCELVPELRLLATGPLEAWDLSGDEARWWFVDACRRLLRAFVGAAAPLVLFLDDVHWMDRASMELLKAVLGDRGIERLVLVVAFRDDEVTPDGALGALLAEPGADEVIEVHLEALRHEDVRTLLTDSLERTAQPADAVAAALERKTAGNPLYLRRFIESLVADGVLCLRENAWDCDLQALESMHVADPQGVLLASSLRAYPPEVRETLNTFACLGSDASLDLLATACASPPAACRERLQRPLADGLVLPAGAPAPAAEERYRFAHDKIADAAYALADGSGRRQRHAQLAARLHAEPELLAAHPFAVVEQLDRAGDDAPAALAPRALAQAWLEAAARARENTAFDAARHYLARCERYLQSAGWDEAYDARMRWHRLAAEVQYQLGNPGQSRSLIYDALEHARGVDDTATLYSMLIVQNTRVGLNQEAIDQGAKALAELGFPLPGRPYEEALTAELAALERIDVAAEFQRLLELPRAQDPRVIKALDILMELLPPTFFKEPVLNRIIAARMTSMSLEHGIAPASPKGIVNYGAALAEHGRFREGYLYGRLAVALADRHGLGHVKPRVLYTLAGGLNHWVNHLRTAPAIVDEGFRLSVEHGERDYGSYLLTLGRCQNEFFLWRPDRDVATFLDEVGRVLAHVEETGNALSTGLATAAYLALSHLAGETADAQRFDRGRYTERELLESSSTPRQRLVDCFFHLLKAHNLLFLDEHDAAREALEKARLTSTHMAAPMGLAIMNLLSSLLAVHALRELSRDDADLVEGIAHIRANHAQMEAWADDCTGHDGTGGDASNNFRHLERLIRAGLTLLEEGLDAAMPIYAQAAAAARASEYPQFEGLAHRELARLWHSREQPYYVRHHLEAALRCYRRWGASRVVDHVRALLEAEGPGPRFATAQPAETPTPTPDLMAVAGMMRHISGDLEDFEQLKSDMALAIAQVAGAQKAVLFLIEDGRPAPVLGRDADGAQVALDAGEYSQGLVNLAWRTGNPVTVEDGVCTAMLGSDPHLESRRPRSALALPLRHRGAVEGVVYIENRINRMDTTAERVALLDVLASQAALSIRNATLYLEREREVRERTRELRDLNEDLERRVSDQAGEIARLGQLERFLSPGVAKVLTAEGGWSRLERHRGEVAIVFCDLRGFSAYSGSVAPEEEGRMLAEYRGTLEALFAHHEATVDHWAGDGAMVFLGDPIPPDPPTLSIGRAVALALEMRRDVARLIAAWRDHGHRLGFGIGITYGYSTMGLTGRDWRMDYSAMGRYVNLCSRLCDAAEDGQILVTRRVAVEVQGEHEVRLVERMQLKGFVEEVEVFDVVGE